jgi:hypothetical protein
LGKSWLTTSHRRRRPINHSVRRLGHLAAALGTASYLEIGVDRGATFQDIDVSSKTGVDPDLKVRASNLEGPGARIEAVPSDQYFASLDPSARFDLVFIDGMHTYEQTYRDLCSTLMHTHDRSVIVIDDTRPSDVYSAVRDQELAITIRRREQGRRERSWRRGDRSWHGDVFKVIFAIHDFHHGLDYATITGPDNPQTVVWRSRAFARRPRFDSFEAIARLTYFDLIVHEDVLRLASEVEVMDTCLRSLLERG